MIIVQKEWLENEIAKSEVKGKLPDVIVEKYFLWKSNEKSRKRLFELLTGKGIFKCDYNDFCNFFVIDNYVSKNKKIEWVYEPMNKRQIAYLFHRLIDHKFISEEQRRRIGVIVSHGICESGGNSIRAISIQKTYSNLKITGKNKSEPLKVVDEIISELIK